MANINNRRDGTSQLQRLLTNLNPYNSKLDNRNFEDLVFNIYKIAEQIRFYSSQNTLDISWKEILPEFNSLVFENENLDLKKSAPIDPSFALILTFLKLFNYVQEDINSLTVRYLEYYFKDILQFKEKPSIPDQVHILFNLNKNLQKYRVKEGTLLSGKDNNGIEIIYRTKHELVINSATVAQLKTVYVDQRNNYCIYAAPAANSLDGKGLLPADDQPFSFKPFGESQAGKIEFERNMETATVGFAIASPLLKLAKADRTIIINIFSDLQTEDTPPDQLLRDAFIVYLSGEKEWFSVSPVSYMGSRKIEKKVFEKKIGIDLLRHEYIVIRQRFATLSSSGSFNIINSFISATKNSLRNGRIINREIINTLSQVNTEWENLIDDNYIELVGENDLSYQKILQLLIKIDSSYPEVLGYTKKLGDYFLTSSPICKIILNTDARIYAYPKMKKFRVREVNIQVKVKDLGEIKLFTDEGVVDTTQPFKPFGNLPKIGASFVFAADEWLEKPVRKVSLDVQWQDVPDNFGDYYGAYYKANKDVASKVLTFRGITSWKGDVFGVEGLDLFNTVLTDTGKGNTQTIDANNNPLWINIFNGTISLPFDSSSIKFPDQNYPKLRFLGAYEYDNASSTPFTVLPDFGHKVFSQKFAEITIAAAKPGGDITVTPLPATPYTPLVNKVRLGYEAEETLSLDRMGKRMELLQMDVFGVRPIVLEKNLDYLLPQLDDEGYLFIGLKDFIPPGQISMLFQLLEGSGSLEQTISPEDINWSYLAGNKWIKLPGLSVIADTIRQFQSSGIVALTIGEDATSSQSLMPSGYTWLSASVKKNANLASKIINIHAQAVAAEFVIHPESKSKTPSKIAPESFKSNTISSKVLAADTINKLLERDAGIKKISQPYASFGGKEKEPLGSFYVRASEHLRHKRRAVSLWDFERMTLEAFPQIYKVKCINHTYQEENYSPGNVSIVVVSNLREKNTGNFLQPRTSTVDLENIYHYLKKYTSPFVSVFVENPIYEEVLVDFKVAFLPGKDPGFYGKLLNDEITRFLSPWAFEEGKDIAFGGENYRSEILTFIENRAYVDYVSDFLMFHSAGSTQGFGIGEMQIGTTFYIRGTDGPTIGEMVISDDFIIGRPVETAVASSPKSILVSAPQHRVRILLPGTDLCSTSFGLGIGSMRIGINFEIVETVN